MALKIPRLFLNPNEVWSKDIIPFSSKIPLKFFNIYNLLILDDLVQPAFLGILLSFCPQWKPTTLCFCSNALFPSSVRMLCYVLFLAEHLLCKVGWKLVLYATSTVLGPLTSNHVSLLLIWIFVLGWVCFATFVSMKTHCCYFLPWIRNRMTTNVCILEADFRGMPALSDPAFLVVGTKVSVISQISSCVYWNVNSPSYAHRFEFYSLQHNTHT